MKIVCENCSAKYSIADEKVKGKVFKIRCKKCGESIVVRGDASKPPEEPAAEPEVSSPPPMPAKGGDDEIETRVFDYSGYQGPSEGEAVWHIVVDGQQQGPYTTGQIQEYLGANSLDPESFIWKEGFEDWLPIKDVPEIAPASGAEQTAPAMGSGIADEPAGGGGGLFDQPDSGGGLFDQPDAGGGLFGGGGEPKAAEVTSPFGGGGGGLFGAEDTASDTSGDVFSSASAAAPATGGLFSADPVEGDSGGLFSDGGGGENDLFGDSSDGGSDGIFSSANEPGPGPVMSAEAIMTGQRNENSVLFSLSNLQALATGPQADAASGGGMGGIGTPLSAPGLAPSSGMEEASGLIDIRSLAGSLAVEKDNSAVDDLISMGGGGGFAPSLGAPVLAPQHEGMGMGIKIAIIAGSVVVAAVIVVLVVVLLSGSDDDAATQRIADLQKQIEAMQQGGQKNDSPGVEALKKQLAMAQTGKSPDDTAAAEAPTGETAEKTDKKDESDNKKEGSSSKSKSKSKGSSSKGSSSRASSSGSPSSSSTSKTPSSSESSSSTKPKKGSDELDDLLGKSLSKPKKEKAAKAPAASSSSSSSSGGDVKASLNRGDVQKGMNSVAGRVKKCGQGQHGTVTLKIVIGKTGRVVSAAPTGQFAGSPIGSCAARAVRSAKFPQSQKNLTVTYPFKF